MNDTRELERHNRIMERIKAAKTIEELPKIGYGDISEFLSVNAYFKGYLATIKFSPSEFQSVVSEIKKHDTFSHSDVLNVFIKTMQKHPQYLAKNDAINLYNNLLKIKRIDYILEEIKEKNKKIENITANANLKYHLEVMKRIKDAHEIGELPKVGLSSLNAKILRAVNNNSYKTDFKTSNIIGITDAYLEGFDYKFEVDKLAYYYFDSHDYIAALEQIVKNLESDKTINYTVQEIRAKEKRKLEIYKENHEETMENIKNATRIAQLPPKLSISTLNKYLLGNSTIYTNDNSIESEDLKQLVNLLIEGKKWNDEAVMDEVEKIARLRYPYKHDADGKLYFKLSDLPRTYYLVEEIKYNEERKREFIKRRNSSVNVYFVPNDKSPIEGGKFYNCYISRIGKNLNLSEILPLDLNKIIPPKMDIDAVEWYVQQNYDPTFKTAGGIIVNQDESIGNISVFRPNDGTIGITPEEKAKMDRINDLDKELEEKQQLVEALDKLIASKKQESNELDSKMAKALRTYEKKVLESQKELLNTITQLKKENGIDEETYKKKM